MLPFVATSAALVRPTNALHLPCNGHLNRLSAACDEVVLLFTKSSELVGSMAFLHVILYRTARRSIFC